MSYYLLVIIYYNFITYQILTHAHDILWSILSVNELTLILRCILMCHQVSHRYANIDRIKVVVICDEGGLDIDVSILGHPQRRSKVFQGVFKVILHVYSISQFSLLHFTC